MGRKVLEVSGCCQTQGWNWVNEGKLANKPKWGFISNNVGAQLVLKASHTLDFTLPS